MKKKMERKGKLRLLPQHLPLSRTRSGIAAAVLTGCMIICILSGSVPLSWYSPADEVYAAQTVPGEEPGPGAAKEQVPGDDGSSDDISAAAAEGKSEEAADDGDGVTGSNGPEDPAEEIPESDEE